MRLLGCLFSAEPHGSWGSGRFVAKNIRVAALKDRLLRVPGDDDLSGCPTPNPNMGSKRVAGFFNFTGDSILTTKKQAWRSRARSASRSSVEKSQAGRSSARTWRPELRDEQVGGLGKFGGFAVAPPRSSRTRLQLLKARSRQRFRNTRNLSPAVPSPTPISGLQKTPPPPHTLKF